jgi:hypothetical protein
MPSSGVGICEMKVRHSSSMLRRPAACIASVNRSSPTMRSMPHIMPARVLSTSSAATGMPFISIRSRGVPGVRDALDLDLVGSPARRHRTHRLISGIYRKARGPARGRSKIRSASATIERCAITGGCWRASVG